LHDVQKSLITYLLGIGWDYVPPEDIMRRRHGNLREPFLPAILRKQLIALNPGLVTEANVDDVIRRLRAVRADLSGSEDFLKALRGRWTVYHEVERRERNLTLIAYDDHAANTYTFTQEFRFEDRDIRRADMLLFINGLPVLLIENKSPTLREPELEAFDQVQHLYTARIPELLKYSEVFAACDARLHYGATWNDSLKAFYRWKVGGRDTGLERLSKSFLARERVLQMLRDYVIFYRADDQTHTFVLRPHQMRTVERIVRRVETEEADTGLIWHTQGSGKSLTMIVAASRLRRLRGLENPTILIVVDRLELESQMVQNLEAFGFPAVQRAESKDHLRDLLAADYRGLIVTLIHKFHDIPKDLTRRENVIVLIDEAHRSQEGDLATFMRAALPNATYFGFTGTPIDRGKVGRGTFETFGKPDPSGYLDKYGIDESVEDGTTVPLYYTLVPLELRLLDRDTLEKEFFQAVEEAGIASIEQLNNLLDRNENLKSILKSDERVDRIAQHIAAHYRDNVEPLGFKAFVVAVDREACALYKAALDQYLPESYTQVVYTAGHHDDDLLRQHHLDDAEEKRIRKAFRDPDQEPKILIVTQKLLTGYDAPVLYAMYLDKPMKDHTLLQAIARVNRPYADKESGLIVDYIGIFENLQRALAFEDETITKGLIDIEELKAFFERQLQAVRDLLAPVDIRPTPGRLDRITDHFFDPETRETFIQNFKDLQTAYEILSPDPFLRDYIDDYALVAQIYQIVYSVFNPEAERRRNRHQVLEKTDQLIRQQVGVEAVGEMPVYPINRDIANVIEHDNATDRVKIINLYRSLATYIEQNQYDQPYLMSIGEQVEDVIQRLNDRQISVQTALEELTDLTEQTAASTEEQDESEMDVGVYTLYWVLRGSNVPEPETVARDVDRILADHPGWQYDDRRESDARLDIYGVLFPRVKAQDKVKALKEIVDAMLKLREGR
jgi:type I restriction enzyme R subunit